MLKWFSRSLRNRAGDLALVVVGNIVGCLIIFSPICIMHDIKQGGYYTFDDKVYLTLDRRATEPLPPK